MTVCAGPNVKGDPANGGSMSAQWAEKRGQEGSEGVKKGSEEGEEGVRRGQK